MSLNDMVRIQVNMQSGFSYHKQVRVCKIFIECYFIAELFPKKNRNAGKSMSVITIIGAGVMGSAISWPLADNHHTIRLVGTHLDQEIIDSIKATRFHPKLQRAVPDGVTAYSYTDIPRALVGADVLISGVSSFGVEWFGEQVGPYMKPEVPVLAITKGLFAKENGDLQILPDHLDDLLPDIKRGKISLNAVAGPCIAQELSARRQTCVYFCGRDEVCTAGTSQPVCDALLPCIPIHGFHWR